MTRCFATPRVRGLVRPAHVRFLSTPRVGACEPAGSDVEALSEDYAPRNLLTPSVLARPRTYERGAKAADFLALKLILSLRTFSL